MNIQEQAKFVQDRMKEMEALVARFEAASERWPMEAAREASSAMREVGQAAGAAYGDELREALSGASGEMKVSVGEIRAELGTTLVPMKQQVEAVRIQLGQLSQQLGQVHDMVQATALQEEAARRAAASVTKELEGLAQGVAASVATHKNTVGEAISKAQADVQAQLKDLGKDVRRRIVARWQFWETLNPVLAGTVMLGSLVAVGWGSVAFHASRVRREAREQVLQKATPKAIAWRYDKFKNEAKPYYINGPLEELEPGLYRKVQVDRESGRLAVGGKVLLSDTGNAEIVWP